MRLSSIPKATDSENLQGGDTNAITSVILVTPGSTIQSIDYTINFEAVYSAQVFKHSFQECLSSPNELKTFNQVQEHIANSAKKRN